MLFVLVDTGFRHRPDRNRDANVRQSKALEVYPQGRLGNADPLDSEYTLNNWPANGKSWMNASKLVIKIQHIRWQGFPVRQ